MELSYRDWSRDPEGWARALGVSREAIEVYITSEVIDLHIDSFIWTRIFGYDLYRRHGKGLLGRRAYSHVDFPRALEARLTGGIWVITTNPFLPGRVRRDVFFKNLDRLKGIVRGVPEQISLVRSVAEYRAAREAGKHGAFLGIQGGNALDYDLRDLDRLEGGEILRITIVHLTNSSLGTTSQPLGRLARHDGLTSKGREYIERLNALKVFVDLAHISRPGFYDALDAHDRSMPLMVTHTGVCGVYDHWRNVDDEQLRAVADVGGTIGVMAHEDFLGPKGVTASTIVDHIEHIIRIVGEDFASIGSDYDGAIVPPADLATPFELPRLVQIMLERNWSPDRIHKILGGNFLRVVEALRG